MWGRSYLLMKNRTLDREELMFFFIVQSLCLESLTLEALIVLNTRVIVKILCFFFCFLVTQTLLVRKTQNLYHPIPPSRKQNIFLQLYVHHQATNPSVCDELTCFPSDLLSLSVLKIKNLGIVSRMLLNKLIKERRNIPQTCIFCQVLHVYFVI